MNEMGIIDVHIILTNDNLWLTFAIVLLLFDSWFSET